MLYVNTNDKHRREMKVLQEIHGRLEEYEENKYRITHKRDFLAVDRLETGDISDCFEFSYEMAFGEGVHRSNRSGGDKKRKPGEIFINTFQGKLAEFAMYRYLEKNGIFTSQPDLSVQGYGIWDAFDLEYGGVHIAVKSTKYYGNLLLLETKDWNERGEYVPNTQEGIMKYDVLVLLRISPDGEIMMRERKWLYSESLDKQELRNVINSTCWEYDIAGCIIRNDLINLIGKKYILPKGALLNGRISMDADNYYVQAGDMRKESELIKRMKSYEKDFNDEVQKQEIN